MAIDTAERRRSLVGLSYHYYSAGVTPNATPDQEWRQESGHSYSGILASAEAEPEESFAGRVGLLVDVGRLIN